MQCINLKGNMLNKKQWMNVGRVFLSIYLKIVSEYDQEIPQSQTADNPVAPLNHHKTSGRQIKQSNQPSLPHQDDCNTRMDI